MATPSQPRYFTIRWLLISLLLFGIGWCVLSMPVEAAPDSQTDASELSIQAAQVTVTPTPTEFSEDVVREGQPTGIIVGAIGIVLIIILGTAPFLLRRRNSHNIE
jgi:hypothetical protein